METVSSSSSQEEVQVSHGTFDTCNSSTSNCTSRLPRIKIPIGKKHYMAGISSGMAVSVISERVFNEACKEHHKLLPCDILPTGVLRVNPIGKIYQLVGYGAYQEFFVIPGDRIIVILGRDFMMLHMNKFLSRMSKADIRAQCLDCFIN